MRIPLLARVCVLCGSNERIERAVRKGVIQHSQLHPSDSQPLRDGKAKAYQVKQVRVIILKYRLHGDVQNV